MTPEGQLHGLSPSTTPTGPIGSGALGKCIDDATSLTTDGNKVQIFTCNGSGAQNWTMYPDGTVRVLGKCLDLAGGATAVGTKIDISTCTGAARQIWQSYQGGGLRNPGSGLCIDDPTQSTTNGTQLQAYTCNASAAQAWTQSLLDAAHLADNAWHHAVLTSDGKNQNMYVDGRLVSFSKGSEQLHPGPFGYAYLGGGYTGNAATNATMLTNLALGTTRYFTGSLGEAAFYPEAVSAADATAHYAAAKNSTGTTPMTTVTVTDPGGHPLVNQYDPLNNNRQIASIDALGNKTSFGYDSGGFQRTVTDPNGNVTTTGHDANGNVVSTTTCQNRAANACATQYSTFQPDAMGLDVAKGATVTSSGISGAAGLTAAGLVDGNTASITGALGFETALQTTANVTQWVQADMGATKKIDQVVLYPRTDTGGGFPLTFTIAVSTDGTTWKTETSQTNSAVPAAGKQAIFTFAPADARYIKLTATVLRLSPAVGKYALDLAELTALNDNPDPTASLPLTQRDGRSASATDNTYLTSYNHDAQGNITAVTTPPVDGATTGRTSKIDYTDGTTVAAADGGFAPAGLPYRTTSPGGAVNLVTYFKNGDVASTTDPNGLLTKFTYDNLGRVLSKTEVSDTYPNGLTTSFSYDGQDRVIGETAPPIRDRITTTVHTSQTATVYDPDGDVTSQTIADTTGGDVPRTATTSYNQYDQPSAATDPETNTTTYEYDSYGHRTAETDPQGNRTEYTFDPNGQLLTQVMANYIGDPVNPQPPTRLTEESRAYDPAGRLASLTDAMGSTTAYTYTDDGRPATVTRTDYQGKNPHVDKSDTYDAAGNLIKEVTNNGATTTLIKVDAASRQSSTTVDPDGVNRTTTLTYTPDDAVATNTSTDGSGHSVTTSATYDKMGHLTSKSVHTDTTGYTDDLTTTWHLDQRGLPTSQTDPDHQVTDFEYDEAGRLAVATAPAVDTETGGGSPASTRPTTKQGYDTFGEANEAQDPDGNITTTGYDRDGHTVSKTSPPYYPPGSFIPITPTVTSTYDSIGNLTKSYDADLHPTSYLYDQLGDLVQTTTPDGGITHSTYDLAGHIRTVTDPTGAEREATYDHLGRTQTSTVIDRYPSPAALTSTYSYAPSGSNPGGAWLASTTSPTGVTTATGYNNLGERISATDGAGNTTTYRYDLLGRLTGQTNPDGTASAVAFDQGSNPIQLQSLDADGAVLTTLSASYDGNGNKLTATDARRHTTHFAYDGGNRLTSETQPVSDSTSITTRFGYDPAGNRTRFTDGRNNSWTYSYNSWGLPESTVEPATSTYTSAADRTTTTTYDNRGLPVAQTLPGGVTLASSYDELGNLKTTSGNGADALTATRTFAYDKDQRLVSAATDATGSLAATAETFGYDDRGDLLSATGDAGSSTFSYNGDGQMTGRSDAAGTAGYGYDHTGRLTTIDDAATGTRLSVAYNKMDQVSAITYGTDGDIQSFGYDPLHRLTSDQLTTKDGAAAASIDYGYDADNNITSKRTVGFTGSATNTYTYDQANRLVSWNDGTKTTAYDYDESGNRIRVGSDVYTYDARDQLTSDGQNTYEYTARGTRLQQNDVVTNSDAYGQTTATGTQRYTYDALGRTLSAGDIQLSYSGTANDVASDGATTYSRDPGGALLGINASGDKRLALVDQHTDVVGTFTAQSPGLSGSTAYDPLGNVLAKTDTIGNLGYQSGWTDPASGNVNMASRWYNPANGQFMNKDTEAQDPVPNSAAANPFAYVSNNPMVGTDPSGHGWLSSAWNGIKKGVSVVGHALGSIISGAWNGIKTAASFVGHAASTLYHDTVDYFDSQIKAIDDEYNREKKAWNDYVAAEERKFAAANAKLKQEAAAYKKRLDDLDHEVAKLSQSGLKYVKNHAAAITTFVVSTGAFIGCEAVLGAVTGGVGAVAGAAACGAVSGAIGGLVDQGFKCGKDHSQCEASAFLKAGLVGGVIGGLAGLGGAVGGKFLKAVGGKALQAIGGVFSRGAKATVEGSTESASSAAAEGAAEGTTESAAVSAEDSSAARAADEPAGKSSPEEEEASCTTEQPHSFTGSTRVVLADGSTKTIDKVKAGDHVKSGVPGKAGTEVHQVERVIVTTTDHDFVDLKVAAKGRSRVARATVALAAGAAAIAGTTTLTTTFHHPFYDRTQATFVEAKDLKPGDDLQTTSGTATVVETLTYHSTAVTYDLTIAGLHTYYVDAGSTPVLVHNVNKKFCDVPTLKGFAKQIREAGDDRAARSRVIAVGQDEDGNLTVASSNRLDVGMKNMAKQLDIRVVKDNAGNHAEEDLLADNDKLQQTLFGSKLKRVASDNQGACGIDRHDCAGQMDALGIEHN